MLSWTIPSLSTEEGISISLYSLTLSPFEKAGVQSPLKESCLMLNVPSPNTRRSSLAKTLYSLSLSVWLFGDAGQGPSWQALLGLLLELLVTLYTSIISSTRIFLI